MHPVWRWNELRHRRRGDDEVVERESNLGPTCSLARAAAGYLRIRNRSRFQTTTVHSLPANSTTSHVTLYL